MNSNQNYAVIILRTDGNHIVMDDTPNFDGAKEKWLQLTRYWEECVHEKKPFLIESPIVTAFDPNFIYEIVLKPKSTQTTSNNPYQRDMLNRGFSETFHSAGSAYKGADILDGGYR